MTRRSLRAGAGHLGNNKPVKRLLVNDYNETKVKAAIAKIDDNNKPMYRGWYNWALARSHYDWMFGLNLTRCATLKGRKKGAQGALPVGSVHTPTLRIIVDRDRVIENFKPVPFFVIKGLFGHAGGDFEATWKPVDGQSGIDPEGRLLDESVAKAVAAKVGGKRGVISEYSKQERKQAPPLMYSLSALQMAANDRFGYSASQVLDACQVLYEKYKATTYPRSDCQYLSDEQHPEAASVLQAVASNHGSISALVQKADVKRKSSVFNSKKVSAHHAIAPTGKKVDLSALSKVEKERFGATGKTPVSTRMIPRPSPT